MKVELHCHSTCSDGSRAPNEVAAMARRAGVELFCLTDHDTVDGYPATRDELGSDARVLEGLELSARAFDRTVHVLVYGLEPGPGHDALARRLEEIRTSRRARIGRIADRLARLGVTIDAESILARAGGKTVGRPDVARALMEAGVVSSFREAFTRFLRDGGPADVPVDRVSVSDALALARNAGGCCSLAHPHTLDHARVRELFRRHRDEGLEGLEVYYGRYGPAEREGWHRLAEDFDLVETGGSDFHGDAMPEITAVGVELPEAASERLRAWLA